MTKDISNQEIRSLAKEVARLAAAGKSKAVVQKLRCVLDVKCPFSKLDLLGKKIGQAGSNQPQKFFQAFDEIIDYQVMGGFVIVGQALISFLEDNFDEVMVKSREYIIKGNVWYVTDIIGERSIGQALVDYFDKTLPWLEKFLAEENRWVKRSAGTAIHFFTKRVRNQPQKIRKLLELVEPRIEEKQKDVAKGIGWGLKTIGKHYPDILTKFLIKQLRTQKNISGLMLRKALTYLDEDKKQAIKKQFLETRNHD